jgi:hypothetical protein
MPNNKPYDKGGIVYYQRKGLKKSVILHLSPETHKKIKYMAWLKETSVQKLLAVEQEQSAANHRPEHPQYITWLLGKLRADRRLQAAAHLIGDRCIDLLRMEGGADGPPNLPRV